MTRYFYNPVSAARLTPERTRVGVLSQGICCEALQTSTFEELLLASMAVPKAALRGETTFGRAVAALPTDHASRLGTFRELTMPIAMSSGRSSEV